MTHASHPLLQQVRAYWEALRVGALPPLRSQIEARGIEAALSHAFLLHRSDGRDAILRNTGQVVNALIGHDRAKTPLSALFGANWRVRMAELTEAVFAGPSVLQLDLTAEDAVAGHRLTGTMQILPLRDAEGRTTEAIGCLVLAGDAPPRVTQFAIRHSQVTGLIPQGTALVPVPAAAPRAIPGFAEPGTAFERPAPTPGKHPNLRLVHTRD